MHVHKHTYYRHTYECVHTCMHTCMGVSLYIEIYLVHWAYRIEDTNALDVDEYYYLFNSPMVRTHLQQTLWEKTLITIKYQRGLQGGLCNNKNSHKHKYQ